MFQHRYRKKSQKDEGEKPFWISYADLMTACMTLFLVVMAVTIVMLKKKYEQQDALDKAREATISACAEDLKKIADSRFLGQARIDYNKGDAIRIDLGSIVKFDDGRHFIRPEASKFLREYIPTVLQTVKNNECKQYFRRVMVEGYTSKTGDYMTNLRLSLERSKEVVCELAKSEPDGAGGLTADEKNQVKSLFFVGGFSFNSQKKSDEESRRAELKLEFWQVGDDMNRQEERNTELAEKSFGSCPTLIN
jgi:outer membrane protein OmpA-like peptidoglycan-associated protein